MATKKEEKVMDVAKPGSTKASPTSRSLIISHGPIMSDPDVKEDVREPSVHKDIKPINSEVMENSNNIKIIENEPITTTADTVPDSPVVSKSTTAATENKSNEAPTLDPDSVEAILKKEAELDKAASESSVKTVSKTGGTRQPDETENTDNNPELKTGTIEDNPNTKADNNQDEVGAEPASVIDVKDKNNDQSDNKDKSASNQTDATPSESAAVGAVADQALGRKLTAKQLEQAAIKEAAVQKLIQDKTYFLPTGHDSTKKNHDKNMILVLLIFILLVAGIYLLLDIGTIKINNFEVPYHLFGNK